VINHLHTFEFEELLNLLSQLVNEHTLFVGFNNIFYQDISDPTITENNGIHFKDSKPGAMVPHGLALNQTLKDHIKSLNPVCQLVLGGPTAHDAGYNRDYDYIVSGYADLSAVNLAQHLADANVPLEKSYRSIYGPTVINDSKAEGFDFANSTMSWQPQDAVLPNEVLPFEMARGCIFKCTFCSYPLNGKKKLDFIKSSERIYQELMDNYTRYGITRYNFVDDTFNDSVEKCRMIWEISQRLPFRLEYWAYIRLDLMAAHPQTVDWLFSSGLRGCFFGIETFDYETGKLVGKGGHRHKLIETLRRIKAQWGNQVMLHGSFIFGLPHESLDSMQHTVDFLLSDFSPLDSWHLKPLRIKADVRNWTSGFLADIDTEYQRYGYRKLGESGYDMLWANEHTTYEDMKKLVNQTHESANHSGHRRISSSYAFQVASLGYDLSEVSNKTVKDFDWHAVTQKKAQRAKEYKAMLSQQLGIKI
jgi:radical SAM superfamily enzyme YgiQ (UPF0313 family)